MDSSTHLRFSFGRNDTTGMNKVGTVPCLASYFAWLMTRTWVNS